MTGRRAKTINALLQETAFTYDLAGNQRSMTDARGHTVLTDYDDLNRPTRVTYQDGTFTETRYDALGRRIQEVDQEGRLKEFAYDGLSRLVKVTQFLAYLADGSPDRSDASKVLETTYIYDEVGNLTAQTDAEGRTTRYEYDSMGRRTARILPEGQRETQTYDASGRLATRTDFNGHTTTYTYDSRDRLTREEADSAHPSLALDHAPRRIEYTYDALGRRTAQSIYNQALVLLHSETYTYNARDRLTQKVSPQGILSYSYDDAGNLLSITSSNDDGVEAHYTYDELNRLQSVEDHSFEPPTLSAYTYDTVGNLDNVQTANGIRHYYTYDGLNRLTNLTIKDGSLNTVASYAYTLRASGHRSAAAEYSGRTTAYAYDALYRLTSETISGDPQLGMGLASYTYDKVGNRLSRTATALGLSPQTLAYTANDWLENDTYDSNGNTLASGASGTDTYDFKNRLLRRTLPNGNTIDLHYNADGHRVRKSLKDAFGYTEQDTHYHTDTRNLTGYAQVLEELTSDGTSLPTVTKRYLYGLDLLAMDSWQSDTPSGGDWHLSYYLYDGHGNVRHLTNQQGQVTDTYTYDAFGILLSRTGTTDNHYRYCGEQWDEDLGMYYLRARYMNTDTGRFWTMDSYEGRNSDPITLHKYLYANANPVMYVDPSGYDSSIAQLNMNVAIFGSLSLMAIPSMRQAITNFGEAARGVAGEIGESAFGYAQQAAGMAAVAAALAYQNFHEQIEKALKDVAQEVKNRLLGLKVVPISKTIMPSIAKHISDVQGGVPQVLTRTDSVTARTNRKSAIAGLGSAGIGMSWDEYPFASTVQGGSGASVRAVPLHENLVQGGVIGVSYRLQNIKFYESFWVIVIP